MSLKKSQHKEYISIGTLSKTQDRKRKLSSKSCTREERASTQAECTEASKRVKKNITLDMWKYVENLTTARKVSGKGI